jgi:cytochrome c oxidase subunit 2
MIIKISSKKAAIAGFVFLLLVGGYLLVRAQKQSSTPPTSTTDSSQPAREINVVAKSFAFEPSTIRVKQGERIRLRLKSTDVTHGFSLPEFAVNKVIKPRKETVVEIQANKKGKFPFSCSVYCGQGHDKMRGVLIVE